MVFMKKAFLVPVAVLVFAGALWAQTPESGQTEVTPTTEDLATPAAQPKRNMFGEAFGGRFNFTADASFQGEYDDNVFSSSVFRADDWTNHFAGLLSAMVQRKHTTFEMHYAPDYRKYNTFSSRDALSQVFSTRLNHAFSARTSMDFNGSVSDATANSLPRFNIVSQGGDLVPVFYPGALQTNTRVLSSTGSIGLTHRTSARQSWDASINGGTSFYSKAPGIAYTSGQDSFTAGASLGWNYSSSARQSFGLQGGHSYFAFTSPAQHQNYDYAKLRYQRKFARQWEFKAGAGPSFRNTGHGADVATSYALDASLVRDWEKLRAGVSYDRGSSLSAVRSALTSSSASAFVSYHASRRWELGGSFGQSVNQQSTNHGLETRSYSASFHGSYSLTRSLSAFTNYSYVQQDSDLVSLSNQFHRNLVSFGLRYSVRPFERF